MNKKHIFAELFLNSFFCVVALSLSPMTLNAFTIDRISLSNVTNDFTLTPAKIEIFVKPEETVTKEISVTNRTYEAVTFTVSVEDFEGSHEKDNTVVLRGSESGAYSLKNYIVPEVDRFTLENGERITFRVRVMPPRSLVGAGRYAAVIIANDAGRDAEKTESGARVVSRLASLFFVRVEGTVEENGHVEDFRIRGPERMFYRGEDPLTFEVLYLNEGTVHLNPYGVIVIRDMFGRITEELPITPFFALPDATRFQEFTLEHPSGFGRYSATLLLNRGYGDIVDERRVTFIIFPWESVRGVLGALFVLVVLIYFFRARFTITRKQP